MNGKRALILSLAAFYVGHLAYYYPQLPERIATHFNASGEPDGWMSKTAFICFEVGLLAFILGLFALISFASDKIPDGLINLPNKEYWLSPERRAATLQTMKNHLEVMQIAVLSLLVSINQMTVQANLRKENLSSASWIVIGAFVTFAIFWSFRLHKKFKIKI